MFVDTRRNLSKEVIDAKLGVGTRRLCKERVRKMDRSLMRIVFMFMFLGK